ncbi:MAG: aldo/keto reductase [Eubacteriales bacterium]|nr:aldo/keto reductase [Eubacteriales bacterium]
MESVFPEIQKRFGFGFMRLPMVDGQVDIPQTMKMVDAYLAAGFNYFDTAHGYLDGQSEKALKTCLTSRYPRERYLLTNKLSNNFFEKQEDIRPLFCQQLAACGVDYFDFYLMHAQNGERFEKYKSCLAYETVLELKAEGKVRHLGISFHDSPQVLDKILSEYPQIEAVQLQFNYLDYDDPKVQSFGCYEVCQKHGKPVFVMEPVKGGALVNLPPQAQRIFDGLGGGSNASYAIRYAAGFPGIRTVLSGMSTLSQVEENVAFMRDFRPLSEAEQAAVTRVRGILRGQDLIPCTGCRYCTEVCPMEIPVPDLFACLNDKRRTGRADISRIGGGRPESCLGCGKCEEACPQGLNIRELVQSAREELGL